MSEKYKPLRFDGVSRADSLTWNPHKLLGTLLQCSTFHLKEKVQTDIELEIILVTPKIFLYSRFFLYFELQKNP